MTQERLFELKSQAIALKRNVALVEYYLNHHDVDEDKLEGLLHSISVDALMAINSLEISS